MSALSNAKTRRDGHDSPTIGLTSNVLPKASSSDTGVSVGNAPPQAPLHTIQRKSGMYYA